jgi:hypothetical protein
MVILHTETCKKKEKLEKNYLHLTIFLNTMSLSLIYMNLKKTWRTNHRMKQNNHHRHPPQKPTPHSSLPPTCTFQLI